MSGRILRPALSPRYRALQQTPARSLSGETTKSSIKTLPRPFYHFSRRTWVLYAFIFTAGASAGALLRRNVTKAPYPTPGTLQDQLLISDLTQRIDNDFKVNVLRGKCLGVARQLKGQEGGWVELVGEPDRGFESLRTSLSGAKGLGVERLFWNRSNETLVAIVWFGPSMSGWPNVTHGGVIATQFTEKIGLAMALAAGTRTQISQAAVPQRLPGTGDHAKMLLPSGEIEEPKELSLSYVKPTLTENFYVIRVSHALPLATDPSHVVPSEPGSGHHEWEATLESMDARIMVKAKAAFEHRTTIEVLEQDLENTALRTYEQFRRWMWPSRQQSLG